ncbi:transketolase [Candidatus Woesearchaeota archaeon]|nr:transketolase [Candidatus Woesearchaeota archaeon]
MPDKKLSIQDLQSIANILRRDSLRMTTEAGSGHPTTCMSCAEIMSALFFHEMRYDVKNFENPDNDEFILSKGHAAPILYPCLVRAGCLKADLLSLRKFGSILEGHPVPHPGNWVKFATGSLGQGLSIGVGVALAGKLQKRNFRTYVLLGDSECAEGSVYESAQLAAHYQLNNLVAVLDANRLGQRGETMPGHHLEQYKNRFQAFGWNAYLIDGHNLGEILDAFSKARNSKQPIVIICKTFKGKGVSFLENKDGWHGKPVPKDQLENALKEIPDSAMPAVEIEKPKAQFIRAAEKRDAGFSSYKIGELAATREAYGKALAQLALADSSVLAVDAEVSNSTFAEDVRKVKPEQFVECFVAEQNMIGMALGLASRGFVPFASTFAAFLSRAHDQLRMGALSSPPITVCGSHAGVSIGEDGGSQMGLEDIGMFRALPNSSVFYPSDAVSAEKLVHLAATLPGVKYIRTTRAKTPVLYDGKEQFKPGEFKVVKESSKDKAVLCGSGITLHEAVKAYDELKKECIDAAVIDLFCIKPFNGKKFIDFARKHGNKVIAAEDHYPEGGIGEMLAGALVNSGVDIVSLAVRKVPKSGMPAQLLEFEGIDAKAFIKEVKK